MNALAASVASLVRPSDPRHGPVAQLLIAWAPLGLILAVYLLARWISAPLTAGGDVNRLGFGLHVSGPADADRVAFGEVPTVWLQERLVDGSPHWYDAAAALVYVTHFVSIPLLTAVVWFHLRHRFTAWVVTVLAFTAIGATGYVAYPAAPPWMAAEQGVVGTVDRISALGWEQLGLGPVADLVEAGQQGSNPVAAMPSLHAGAALLIALFLWRSVGTGWRAVLLAHAAAMALTLVYTGEHYVVDVVAGWATAAAALAAGAAVRAGRDNVGPGDSLSTETPAGPERHLHDVTSGSSGTHGDPGRAGRRPAAAAVHADRAGAAGRSRRHARHSRAR